MTLCGVYTVAILQVRDRGTTKDFKSEKPMQNLFRNPHIKLKRFLTEKLSPYTKHSNPYHVFYFPKIIKNPDKVLSLRDQVNDG